MKNVCRILLLALTFFLQPAWGEDVSDFDGPSQDVLDRLRLPADLEDGSIATLRIANRRIRVEIANTQSSRERGLMQRTYMCEECGMLFVFEKEDNYNFWMKNTLLPLSIAFIASDGSILNIDEMLPNTLDSHSSQGKALYVLEMNKGWFGRNGITPGTRVQSVKRVPKSQ